MDLSETEKVEGESPRTRAPVPVDGESLNVGPSSGFHWSSSKVSHASSHASLHVSPHKDSHVGGLHFYESTCSTSDESGDNLGGESDSPGNRFHEIPSTLEFTREKEEDDHTCMSYISPSSLRTEIEMEGGDLPQLPFFAREDDGYERKDEVEREIECKIEHEVQREVQHKDEHEYEDVVLHEHEHLSQRQRETEREQQDDQRSIKQDHPPVSVRDYCASSPGITRPVDSKPMTGTDRLFGFRRRFNVLLDAGIPNASPEEFPSRSRVLSVPSSVPRSRSLRSGPLQRFRFRGRTSLRFALVFGTMLFIFLSIHDNMRSSRRYYRELDQLLSSDTVGSNRRDEIAFPFVQLRVREPAGGISHTNEHGSDTNQQSSGDGRSRLPKFVVSRVEPSLRNKANANANARNAVGGGAHNNLAMARGKEHSRPLFVPGVPFPTGGVHKPLERFVFEDSRKPLSHHPQDQHRGLRFLLSLPPRAIWMISLVLVALVLDKRWREGRVRRTRGLPLSRTEERRERKNSC